MRITTTLALLVLAFGLSAQVQDYFAENPEWRQSYIYGDEPCIQNTEFIYYVNGDSVINDTLYKKLFRVGEQKLVWNDPPPIPDWCNNSWTFNDLYILIRQEEHKVYYRDTWTSKDFFIYDFNLSIGDTLTRSIVVNEDNIIVTSIDSLLVGNNYRKVFNFESIYWGNYSLIEGIGHSAGFLEPFYTGNGSTYLLCYTLNKITYYPEFNAPCDLTINIPTEVKIEKVIFYPNPAKESITIELDNSLEINNVSAYDITGRQIQLRYELLELSSMVIDISLLNKGLYFIQIIDDGNTNITLKVIKE